MFSGLFVGGDKLDIDEKEKQFLVNCLSNFSNETVNKNNKIRTKICSKSEVLFFIYFCTLANFLYNINRI